MWYLFTTLWCIDAWSWHPQHLHQVHHQEFVLSSHSSEEEDLLNKFWSLSYPVFRGGFVPWGFPPYLYYMDQYKKFVKGDLCLSFQGLNKSCWISCTKLGLSGGVGAIIYLSTLMIYLGDIIIFLVLMFYGITWAILINTGQIGDSGSLIDSWGAPLRSFCHLGTYINWKPLPYLTRGSCVWMWLFYGILGHWFGS